MSRYSKGETSAAKLQEKQAKTQSLITKILLIRKAIEDRQRLPSLDALKSKRGIPFKSALNWSDADLGVISCSYNTSREPYNTEYSDQLAAALETYNNLTPATQTLPPQKRITQRSQQEEISTLKNQVDYLTNTLGEVYRAYMQLVARVDEHTRQDLRYQQVLKSHTLALDRAHLTLVKP
ncbi:TPA: hypothetical protein NHR00_002610 [Pseudomonas aeruginosa]|uniref:hypothetical protein n=1 Tax=Pseudomonadaceae TaxID=135621 RepID=UPI00129D08B9|nr:MULTISPECIES: hypothetical protein [Pseudomonadaceae]HBO1072967.1 hypothetical protein [Pseudomonas aeruginosa]HBO1987050.1 hypothetical protein [Pseudomonas aeruginosa]HBO8369824.1 hypothetical protein [Pseudomonas aeruginosa]HCE6936554.1 hypothetical protein [Pseudomonas aeruginosa]HCE7667891.1 hypothetical protein [Pseudomonas aeruginosa]